MDDNIIVDPNRKLRIKKKYSNSQAKTIILKGHMSKKRITQGVIKTSATKKEIKSKLKDYLEEKTVKKESKFKVNSDENKALIQ
mgnify:CR=1 FL=1